jgi:uncharacterized membrane protein YhhN
LASVPELPAEALGAIALAALSVTALVVCDYRQYRPGRYLFKPLSALAFLWLALAMGAAESGYGLWIFAGLLCSAAGDILLMPDSQRSFLAGLLAFLCGHLCYAAGFLHGSYNTTWLVLNGVAALALLALSLRWLLPHLDTGWKAPVILYTTVITGMLLSAGLRATQPGSLAILAGAWGFAFSDLAVARQRFVEASRVNGLWGTPLYFLSQMLLAASVAAVQS